MKEITLDEMKVRYPWVSAFGGGPALYPDLETGKVENLGYADYVKCAACKRGILICDLAGAREACPICGYKGEKTNVASIGRRYEADGIDFWVGTDTDRPVVLLHLAGDGGIYVKGRLAANDKEVVDALRHFLRSSGYSV